MSRLGTIRRAQSRTRAFTLVEILVTLSLMAIFGLLADRVFHLTATVMREAPAAMNASQRMTHAMHVLQRAIWMADGCTVISPTELQIGLPDGKQKQVRIDGSRMVMTADANEEVWNDLAGDITFARQGVYVIATVVSGQSKDEIWLPMAKPWAEGMAP